MQFKKHYSRFVAIFCIAIFSLNFNYAFSTPKSSDIDNKISNILSDNTVPYGVFIMELAQITKVNLTCTRGSDAKVNFKDVKDKDQYAKALMDAQFLGFIAAKNKLIQPQRPITLIEATQLALNYFMYSFKNADSNKFSIALDTSFKKKYAQVKNSTTINRNQADYIEDYLRYQMALAKRKIGKDKVVKYVIVSKVVATSNRIGDKLYVTLDWGVKPTTGYSIKILGYSYDDGLLIVSYVAKEPGPNDKVKGTFTSTKARTIIDASKMKQKVKILALGQR